MIIKELTSKNNSSTITDPHNDNDSVAANVDGTEGQLENSCSLIPTSLDENSALISLLAKQWLSSEAMGKMEKQYNESIVKELPQILKLFSKDTFPFLLQLSSLIGGPEKPLRTTQPLLGHSKPDNSISLSIAEDLQEIYPMFYQKPNSSASSTSFPWIDMPLLGGLVQSRKLKQGNKLLLNEACSKMTIIEEDKTCIVYPYQSKPLIITDEPFESMMKDVLSISSIWELDKPKYSIFNSSKALAKTKQATIVLQEEDGSVIKPEKKKPAHKYDRAIVLPFVIQGVSRTKTGQPIPIDIAALPNDMVLTDENLRFLFKFANHHTLNKPYPCLAGDVLHVDGTQIPRPIHNGTHSAREVRLLEAVLELIEHKGSKEAKAILSALSEEEILNLKLAAYFFRAGRVDESSHTSSNPDDYYTRSAQIYEAYAKQLKVKSEIIEWIKVLLVFSCCKPKDSSSIKEIDANPKNLLFLELLKLVHEFDLVRIYKGQFDSYLLEMMKNNLKIWLEDQSLCSTIVDMLLDFARDLCVATGSQVMYGKFVRYNYERFAECSQNGDTCFDVVRDVALPLCDFDSFYQIARNHELTFLDKGRFKPDPKLSQSEMLAIRCYTTHHYEPINAILAKREDVYERFVARNSQIKHGFRDALLKVIKLITKALPKLPTFNGTVYRGTNLTDREISVYRPGTIVTEPRFLSSSEEFSRAKSFTHGAGKSVMFTITNVIHGKRISDFANSPSEKEVLFRPGRKFRVLSKTFTNQLLENVQIELEEVPA